MVEEHACSAMTDDARDTSIKVTNREWLARARARAAKHALHIGAGAIALALVATSPAAMAEAPMFSDDTLTRTIVENTARATDIGEVIPSATDADDGDTLTYTMEGADADAFEFDGARRQIKTKATLDFETKASYSVKIRVTDSMSGTDTVDVTIAVTDDGKPAVRITGGSADEGDDVSFTIALSSAATGPATVTWSASASGTGSTASPNDVASASGTVTFSDGDVTKTVMVSTTEDDIYEANETFSVTLTNPTGDAELGENSTATGTINNDEALPTITLVMGNTTLRESAVGAGEEHRTTMTPTVDINAQADVSVTVTTVADELRQGSALEVTKTYVIQAEQFTAGVQTIEGVDNDIDEPNRSATVTIDAAYFDNSASGLDGVNLSKGANPVIIITDEDDPPTVTLTLGPDKISESGTQNASTVTAQLTGRSSEATTITVSAHAVSPAVDGDFALNPNNTLVVPARERQSTGTVTVTAVNNTVDAANKRVTVSATAANTHGDPEDPEDQELEIRDDEVTPQVTLVLGTGSIDENGGTTTVKARLPHASSHDGVRVGNDSDGGTGRRRIHGERTAHDPSGSAGERNGNADGGGQRDGRGRPFDPSGGLRHKRLRSRLPTTASADHQGRRRHPDRNAHSRPSVDQ